MSRAFIFAGNEDFGIVGVEAQACGLPVIAYHSGGFAETVVNNETGIFFHTQTVDAIISAINQFEKKVWIKQKIRKNALRFSELRFEQQIKDVINRLSNQYKEEMRSFVVNA
jgi:glycosyltransferase involved in cell wall biosynthesis